MAVIAILGRTVLERRFVNSKVVPITATYVSSVGYGNGQIVWLRANDVSPHHPNHFDEWIVPMEMDVASNDGTIGTYKKFGDRELKSFVAEHPYLRALDARDSLVTCDGLIHPSELGAMLSRRSSQVANRLHHHSYLRSDNSIALSKFSQTIGLATC